MNPLAAVVDLLAPDRCVRCDRRATAPWCPACSPLADALTITDACPRCGREDATSDLPHGCWATGSPIRRTWVAYRYRETVADAIVRGKAAGRATVWPGLGERLADVIGQLPATATVTWVPTEPSRRRDRGYDHARLVAGAVARGLARPLVPTLRAKRGVADRGRADPGAVAPLPPDAFRATARIPTGPIVLVDDVLTTGATATAAAVALQRAGAGPIGLAVVARAGRHDLATDGVAHREAHDRER